MFHGHGRMFDEARVHERVVHYVTKILNHDVTNIGKLKNQLHLLSKSKSRQGST
jgi:hypothetical protein